MNARIEKNPEIQFFYDHKRSPVCVMDQGPLAGLRHRTVIDQETGARAMALWQEEHLPGFCVPPHYHDSEEIITVLSGAIIGTIGNRVFRVEELQSILIPAWLAHGFTVVSSQPVRLLALFSSSNPLIFRMDGTLSNPPWKGGASDHLDTTSS